MLKIVKKSQKIHKKSEKFINVFRNVKNIFFSKKIYLRKYIFPGFSYFQTKKELKQLEILKKS